MPTKLESLLESFQGNAYPAMLADLGQHLGVSENSLRRLALGWCPIVEFKKGRNFQGWWVSAERDADGDVRGLSLRSQSDTKVMYPGSNHGLVYEVNPNHSRGEHGYSAGASNWVRAMDAGLLCPMCGKPDGCLLSAEQPSDPKAVVCIRVTDGAVKPMKFGWLHIRKADGHLHNSSALAQTDEWTVIVEGMSDTAAALDLNFDGVGRPSNLACMDLLCDLVRGRKAIIVGENDRKADGREPGKEGMVATFQMVQRVCREVRMVMPPEHIKDLRAWKVKYGLTRQQFLDFVQKQGQEYQAATVIEDDRPTTIARAFLDSSYRMAKRYTLRRWESTWYRYGGSKYVPLKDEAFIQPLYQWAYDKKVQRVNPKGGFSLAPLVANNTLVTNVSQAIVAETLVPAAELPCWINNHTGPSTRDLIVFTNGILHVPSYLSGSSDALLDSTPDLFTTSALPFSFDPTASCPAWLSFLESSLGDEPEKIALLQEWIGYCLTPDTSMDKIMFFRGPTAAGKTKILNILCALVGKEQSAATSFADLSSQFGVAPLVGKLICVIPDARTPRGGDTMRGLELLLNIGGNDGVQVNRKFKDQLERHKIGARITIASNEFLDVPDHAGAMIRRLNVIEFQRSFAGREDYGLEDRLMTELQGIANWALAGLKRLRETRLFTVPPSSRIAIGEWRTTTSPIAAFLEECCDQDGNGEIGKNELYDAWSGWSTERRIWQMSKSRFYERIRSNAPYALSETYEKQGHKHSIFRGLTLKRWAQKQFLGKPN